MTAAGTRIIVFQREKHGYLVALLAIYLTFESGFRAASFSRKIVETAGTCNIIGNKLITLHPFVTVYNIYGRTCTAVSGCHAERTLCTDIGICGIVIVVVNFV